jgi:iron complex transport system ATP-binding protein
MTALVEARNLEIRGRLRQTSLTLHSGELTCLVGPNGSGKTSLLHALAGIGNPSGDVTIDGIDPRPLGPHQRRQLYSYLPASRDINWPLSARDVIALGSSGAEDGGRIDRILADLDLSEMADRRIDRMSTGERSRVLIARALVAEPKLLLLDEPAANLDPLWQLRLMEHVRKVARENGRSALVAVHDLELAGGFADRLIVMDGGSIVADGDPQSLLSSPVMSQVFGIEKAEGRWHALR